MTEQEQKKNKLKRVKISNIIRNLNDMPRTSVEVSNDLCFIDITNKLEYVPDFTMLWCDNKNHFRVYIHLAHTKHDKERKGYAICVIPNGLAAAGFVMFYSFLHKNRANNKTSAE